MSPVNVLRLSPFYDFITSLARLPALGSNIPQSGGVISRTIGRWALAAMRWRLEGEIPDRPKLVIIVAPHTSNWDFVVAVSAKLALGLDVRWFGKHTLFRGALGAFMRAMGGMPIDRSGSHDVVKEIVEEFRRAGRLVIGIAPEGTRKRVERWRTGFYHIAHGAGVPVVPVALDYGTRDESVVVRTKLLAPGHEELVLCIEGLVPPFADAFG
jgi:1-acyl-sn-glycerol-3-phosphate acyltransferase